jgi:hypothetical protein
VADLADALDGEPLVGEREAGHNASQRSGVGTGHLAVVLAHDRLHLVSLDNDRARLLQAATVAGCDVHDLDDGFPHAV